MDLFFLFGTIIFNKTKNKFCFRLYPEEEYSKFDDTTQPEMVRTNLNSAVLNLMALGIGMCKILDFGYKIALHSVIKLHHILLRSKSMKKF